MTLDFKQGYLFTGNKDAGLKEAFSMAGQILKKPPGSLNSDPDFLLLETDVLSIDDSRLLRNKSFQKSFSGNGRVFIIRADFFTKEASNALLKTLEEPSGQSVFFIVTGSGENLPATVRSRLTGRIFKKDGFLPEKEKEFVLKFLNSTIDERLELSKPFMSDKGKATSFLGELGAFLSEGNSNDAIKNADMIEEIAKCRELLFSRASFPKMVLEHLAYFLPRVK